MAYTAASYPFAQHYPGRTESPFVALLPKHVSESYPEVGQLSPYRRTACLLTIYKLSTGYL